MIKIYRGAGEPDVQDIVAPSGLMSALITRVEKTPSFTIRSLVTAEGDAAFVVDNGNPHIRYATSSGDLVLTTQGYSLPPRRLMKYSDDGFKELGNLIKSDKKLQASVFKLRRAMTQTVYGFAAIEGIPPAPQLAKKLLESNNKQMNFGTKPRDLDCSVDRIVTSVTTEVYGWITEVVTAFDQAAACAENCSKTYNPLDKPVEYLFCMANCTLAGFTNIVTRTMGVVETITEEVVTEVTHCSPIPNLFPAPTGPYQIPEGFASRVTTVMPPPDLALVAAALGPFADIIGCMLQGQWKFSNLGNLRVNIDGIRDVPIGVTVCFDRACTDKLKVAATGPALVQLLFSVAATLSNDGAIKAWLESQGLTSLVTELARLAGLTAEQFTGLLLVLLVMLAVHALIVGGQIMMLDWLGAAPNGVCLTYPAVPVLVVGSFVPFIAPNVALQTPIIVTPR